MGNITKYTLVNETHLTLGDAFVKKVIEALTTGQLDIKAYSVQEYSYQSDESIKIQINDKLVLNMNFTHSK